MWGYLQFFSYATLNIHMFWCTNTDVFYCGDIVGQCMGHATSLKYEKKSELSDTAQLSVQIKGDQAGVKQMFLLGILDQWRAMESVTHWTSLPYVLKRERTGTESSDLTLGKICYHITQVGDKRMEESGGGIELYPSQIVRCMHFSEDWYILGHFKI